MAVNPNGNTTTLTGTVTACNPQGIRLLGHQDWLNFSRFGNLDVPHPALGEKVTVQVDGRGFIKALDILEGSAHGSTDHATAPTAPAEDPDRRQALIIRQVAVKAAVDFLAPRSEAKSEHILALAEKLETWINR